MELVLIRHTRTAAPPGICYGAMDVALAASAEAEIQMTLSRIPRIDTLFTSPAQRCRRLANALEQRERCNAQVATELIELHFGTWEGQPWAQIPREQSDVWAADPWNRAPPGGETESALWERVATWYARELLTSGAARAAIVAHGGPLRILRCLALGLTPPDHWNWTPGFGEVASIDLMHRALVQRAP